MRLWWAKNPKPVEPCDAKFYSWVNGGEYCQRYQVERYNLHSTQGTGCGMKIGQLPLSSHYWYRYLTLMRMPTIENITDIQVKWLDRRHFRYLGEGSLASYWVNGWKPEEYSVSKEKEYWKEHDPENRFVVKKANGTLEADPNDVVEND
jgi:hypothetical protein